MKYNFENSQYAKMWNSNEGRDILGMIINDPELVRSNFDFWKEAFIVDPYVTPTDATGAAIFKSEMKEIETGELMELRAPLGDSTPRDKKGVQFYTGTIPDLITYKTVETAAEREYKEKMFESAFGNDAFIVSQFVDTVQRKFDSANMTLSNMSAQLLSKGNILYKGGNTAAAPLLKADIPAENFCKAGVAVWNAPDCKILDQMLEIQNKYQNLWGVNFAMQWDIPYDMFQNVFLKNAQVIEWVRYYKSLNNTLLPEKMPITTEMFNEAIRLYEGLYPIHIVEEKQVQGGILGTKSVVKGWADNIAVLRPAGFAGLIRHTDILDEKMYKKYGANNIERVFASSNSGLFLLMNTTLNNGNLKEWQSELMMSSVPSLTEFLYHVIVDTQSANE